MKRSSKPDFKKLEFIRNESRTDIYDLQTKGFRKFKYFRLSVPRSQKFIQQGAKYIIESWEEGNKILFSGLISLGGKYYYGDHRNPVNGSKSFLIAMIEHDRIVLYYFNCFNLYPSARIDFVRNFLKDNARPPEPGISSKPSTDGR